MENEDIKNRKSLSYNKIKNFINKEHRVLIFAYFMGIITILVDVTMSLYGFDMLIIIIISVLVGLILRYVVIYRRRVCPTCKIKMKLYYTSDSATPKKVICPKCGFHVEIPDSDNFSSS